MNTLLVAAVFLVGFALAVVINRALWAMLNDSDSLSFGKLDTFGFVTVCLGPLTTGLLYTLVIGVGLGKMLSSR